MCVVTVCMLNMSGLDARLHVMPVYVCMLFHVCFVVCVCSAQIALLSHIRYKHCVCVPACYVCM